MREAAGTDGGADSGADGGPDSGTDGTQDNRTEGGPDSRADGGCVAAPNARQGDGRGQLSLSLVEAGVGVLFVVAVASAFAFGTPAGGIDQTAQLDAYARDAATVLANEPPQHGDATRLAEVAASADAFDRERAALERRVDRILPANLLFSVETPHGTVGHVRPSNAPVGVARVPTGNGRVTIRVWYA